MTTRSFENPVRAVDKPEWKKVHVVDDKDKTLCGYWPWGDYEIFQIEIGDLLKREDLCRQCIRSLQWFATDQLEKSGTKSLLKKLLGEVEP